MVASSFLKILKVCFAHPQAIVPDHAAIA